MKRRLFILLMFLPVMVCGLLWYRSMYTCDFLGFQYRTTVNGLYSSRGCGAELFLGSAKFSISTIVPNGERNVAWLKNVELLFGPYHHWNYRKEEVIPTTALMCNHWFGIKDFKFTREHSGNRYATSYSTSAQIPYGVFILFAILTPIWILYRRRRREITSRKGFPVEVKA